MQNRLNISTDPSGYGAMTGQATDSVRPSGAMSITPSKNLLITGTGTDVGKTYVSGLIASALRERGVDVGVYKPVSSGCELRDGVLVSPDAEHLWQAAGRPRVLRDVSPLCFAAAVAPNVAARLEKKSVDAALLRNGIGAWSDSDVILVEGVGGLMSPISDEDLVVDLAVDFAFPMLVVVANRLGCINDTLQTLAVAAHRGLQVAGVILNDVVARANDESLDSNRLELERLASAPVLARVRHGEASLDLGIVERLLALPE